MQRKALEKIVELYKTSPVFQDLVETAAVTGITAGGHALLTDMSPEQIALASAAGFGAGMVGRPIVGRAGQAIGGVIDRRAPKVGESVLGILNDAVESMPGPMKKAYEAKLGPYAHLGGAAQYGNLIGRNYGDNAAQMLAAFAAPSILGDNEDA